LADFASLNGFQPLLTDRANCQVSFFDMLRVGISFAGGFFGTNSADCFAAVFAGVFLGDVDATFFLGIKLNGPGKVGFDSGLISFD
jgi:hypothetical protein